MFVGNRSIIPLQLRLPFSTLLLLVVIFSQADAQSLDSKISRLINLGQIEYAESLLEASNPDEVDRLFFAARVLKALRKYLVAIEMFEEILERDPYHINAKRELAHTLILAKDFNNAEEYFQELLLEDNSETMRNGYRRFLSVINENKPFAVNLQFSLLPSSNINKGTSNTVFNSAVGDLIIEPSLQADSGVGARIEISGFFRHLVSPISKVELSWSLSGTKYGNELHNRTENSLAVSYENSTSNGRWSFEGFAKNALLNGGSETNTLGGEFKFSKAWTNDNSVAFSILREYRNYPLSTYRNGPFTTGAISMTHLIEPGLSVSGGLRSELSLPDAKHLQYVGYESFATIAKIWSGGTHSTIGFLIGERKFSGNYPLTNTPRLDSYYGFNFSLKNSRLQYYGFTPTLSCVSNSNRSNVSIFEFESVDCSVGISKEY